MKKNYFALIGISAVTISLAGCSLTDITLSPPQAKIDGGYQTSCTVKAYIIPPNETAENETEFTFSGSLCRLGSGFWEMNITSPETIAGLSVSTADDILTTRLGDLSFDTYSDKLPDTSPLTSVFSSLDAAAAELSAGNSLTSGEEGGWVYSAENYTIIFDSEGIPVSMAMPKMTVEFTEFTLTENMPQTARATQPSETSEVTTMSETAQQTTQISTSTETTPAQTTSIPETTVISTQTSLTETQSAASTQ